QMFHGVRYDSLLVITKQILEGFKPRQVGLRSGEPLGTAAAANPAAWPGIQFVQEPFDQDGLSEPRLPGNGHQHSAPRGHAAKNFMQFLPFGFASDCNPSQPGSRLDPNNRALRVLDLL